MATDEPIHETIEQLVAEEHELWQREAAGEATDADRARLESIKISLDQCWDLLRRRRALRDRGPAGRTRRRRSRPRWSSATCSSRPRMTDHPSNGRRWRLPISPPPDADSMLVPWWIPPLFVAFALALAPWIVWLFVSLPSQEVANNWEVAWGGFDVALGVLLAATGISLARRSPVRGDLASMTAGILSPTPGSTR